MIKPIGDKILVKIKKNFEEITKSGIILPESSIDSPLEGIVIQVGAGILTSSGTRVPVDVKIGDRVLFKHINAGVEIELNEEPHILLTEHDIIGVVE